MVAVWCSLAALYVLVAVFNSTTIFDDPYIFKEFTQLRSTHSLGQTLRMLFFILDLNGQEYRLYGVSKILHYGLWAVGGVHAWFYASFIAAMQFAAGTGIFLILRRLELDKVQCLAVATVWIFSPFSVTTCFHHYSYLLLPYQITIFCALTMQAAQNAKSSLGLWRLGLIAFGFLLVTTGDSHLHGTLTIVILTFAFARSPRGWRSRLTDLAILLGTMVGVLAFIAGVTQLIWQVSQDRLPDFLLLFRTGTILQPGSRLSSNRFLEE